MKKFLFAAAGLAFVNIATAQSTIEGDATLNNLSLEKAVVTEPGEDSPKKPLELGGVQISGYVDGYWQTNLNGSNDAPVQDRSFYGEAQTFALGNANLTFEKEMGKFGGVAQLGFGPRAVNANGRTTPTIQQMYVYFKASEALTLTAGTFGTFVGYEVIDAPANFHYSTSNLFQNGPFFHTGVKADVDLGGGLTAMVGVFNDTDSQQDTNGDVLHVGGQLGYSNDTSNVFLNGLYGKTDYSFEDMIIPANSSSLDINELQVDLVADTTIEDIYLALNASYYTAKPVEGDEDALAWYGVAGYAQYGLTDNFSAGVRVEYMNNEDNLILNDAETLSDLNGKWGNEGSVFAVTASAPYSKDGFTFIPEVRFDIAENDVYQGESTQITLGAAINYAF